MNSETSETIITRQVLVSEDTAAAGYQAAIHLLRKQAEMQRGLAASSRSLANTGRGSKTDARAKECHADGVEHALSVLENTEVRSGSAA
jgi:hypothetical protein